MGRRGSGRCPGPGVRSYSGPLWPTADGEGKQICEKCTSSYFLAKLPALSSIMPHAFVASHSYINRRVGGIQGIGFTHSERESDK